MSTHLKRALPFFVAFAALLLGVSGRSTGYIDMAKAIAAHPFYPILVQDDRQIAAYRSTRAAPRIPALSRAAMEPAGMPPFPALKRIGTAEFRGRITAEMNRYEQALHHEENAALRTYARAIAARTNAAYAGRAEEFQEIEGARSYHLARVDAPALLHIRVRLQTLVLSGAERLRLTHERAAIIGGEKAALAVLRRRDAARLAVIRARLDATARKGYAVKAARTRADMSANLAARRRVMQAQLAAAVRPRRMPVPSGSAVMTAYQGANASLVHGDAVLRMAQNSDRSAARSELARVQAARNQLYAAITAQIRRLAKNAARTRGLSGVRFTGPRPRGSVDLTSSVLASLRKV